MTINRQAIITLLKEGFAISRRTAKIETIQENWIVRWEDYFNPHANPKSLFSEKPFSDIEVAVDFFLEKVSESYAGE